MVDLILIGGFLGSGKTTLLAEAAKKLAAQGKKVGLITNDQAPGLVDTRLLSQIGQGVSEVAGSCFCCNFPGFVAAIESLIAAGADTIVAEPVGSCTDLSATIMNPLKKFHPDWKLAPLTVLVDPQRLFEVFGMKESMVDPDALYIMKLQMDEADRVLVNKGDTLSTTEKAMVLDIFAKNYSSKPTGIISAKTGDGVESWLAAVQSDRNAGKTIVPVDYDRYAHGEAVLGWLNATATVDKAGEKALLQNFMADFQAEIRKTNSEVGHVKAILNLGDKEYVANLTSLNGDIDIREVTPQAETYILIFNARVQMSPENLEEIVRKLLGKYCLSIGEFRCLMPGRPNPTHRFSKEI